MGRKNKSGNSCLYGMMGSFLVLVSLVIVVSVYKDYKHRQIYANVDMKNRQKFHKSAYKTRLAQLANTKQHERPVPTPAPEPLKAQFYDASSILATVQVNLTKFGGPLRGQVRGGQTPGTVVVSYLGIPYAQAPIGELQFEPSKVASPWTKPLDAIRQPPKCPQGSHYFSALTEPKANDNDSESENCLFLNIWTPHRNRSQSRKSSPVLVYFHSGLFSFGGISSPDVDPSNLVSRESIVVVTVQYRLGVYGFGSLKEDSSVNSFQSAALIDQSRALEWINANIDHFGGDPNQITVAGHGSSAVMVGAHLLNEHTNKLFSRVILQGLQNIWNIGIYGLNHRATQMISDEFGCELEKPKLEFVRKCFKQTATRQSSVINSQHFLLEKHPVPFGPEFSPYTEKLSETLANKEFNNTGAPLTNEELVQLFQDWNIFPKHVEFLIGLNSDEDYKLDAANKPNRAVKFEDEEEEEEEENEKEKETKEEKEEDDEETEEETSETNDATAEQKQSNLQKNRSDESKASQNGGSTPVNNKSDHEDEEEDESKETADESSSPKIDASEGDGISDNNNESKKSEKLPKLNQLTKQSESFEMVKPSFVEVNIESDAETTTTTSPSVVEEMKKQQQRNRRSVSLRKVWRARRAAAEATNAPTSGVDTIQLERDEIAKLCKLVTFYRAQKTQRSVDEFSNQVSFYRIEPRVLLSPLEEVSIAFRAKQKNWLRGFDDHVSHLWASFVKTGSVKIAGVETPTALSTEPSTESNSDTVTLINLSQVDAIKSEDTSADASQSEREIHDSQLSLQTISDLTKLCNSI